MKFCHRCHDPIYRPGLPDSAIEICPACDNQASGLDQLLQEAFVSGVAVDPRGRPCHNRVVLDSSLER